jgi:hypothetical protein
MIQSRTPEPVAPKKTIAARLQELKEIHNTFTSILSRDEATAEFVHLHGQLDKGGDGQIVQPPVGGYQPNDKGISAAARELVMLGKTDGARRKHVERALKIANLPPDVKKAAIEARLENKRMDLLDIASQKSVEAMLAKIKVISERGPRAKKPAATPPSGAVKSDEALSALTYWWEASPPDAKTRFKSFIDAAGSAQAA